MFVTATTTIVCFCGRNEAKWFFLTVVRLNSTQPDTGKTTRNKVLLSHQVIHNENRNEKIDTGKPKVWNRKIPEIKN